MRRHAKPPRRARPAAQDEGDPIATVALEISSTNEELRRACADVFEAWIAGATARFADGGMAEERARSMAIEVICALEGAFVLCRAMRSTEPLEVAGRAAVAAMRDALGRD